MNTAQAILGTNIAILKLKSLSINPVNLILEGVRTARQLNLADDIINQGTGKPRFRTGNIDISPIGTAVQLTTESIAVPEGKAVTVIGKPGNSGVIYFGNSKEECEDTTRRFDGLDPALAHSFPDVNNVNEIWVDAATDSDGVSWYVGQ